MMASSSLVKKDRNGSCRCVFLLLMTLIIIGCFSVYYKGRSPVSSLPSFQGTLNMLNTDPESKSGKTKLSSSKKLTITSKPDDQRCVKMSGSPSVKTLIKQLETAQTNGMQSANALTQFKKCAGRVLSTQSGGYEKIPSHGCCKMMSFGNSGLTAVLVSYPGSGNSWVRLLLETTSGIYSGSVSCDTSYVQAGMVGEGVNSNVIVVKAHFKIPSNLLHDRIIYLIRNPFTALVADWKRYVSKKFAKNTRHVNEVGQEYFGKYVVLYAIIGILNITNCQVYQKKFFSILNS